MTHALGDVERGEAHVDERAHVAVAKVVDTYPLDARRLAAAVHLVHEEVLREAEEPLVGRDVLARISMNSAISSQRNAGILIVRTDLRVFGFVTTSSPRSRW